LSRSRWLSALLTIPLLATVAAVRPQAPVEPIIEERAAPVDHGVAGGLGGGIPADMTPRVERWMDAFQTTRRDEFEALLARRELYADLILTKLHERGMPEELLYIPMIESGLSPIAVSHVSAVGLWQFMSPTAEQYGLRVDAYVDARRDPEAATDAALDYLAWLHHRFGGSWALAAAAFNAGPGRVERVLNRHAEGWVGDDQLFWDLLEYLPRETREYVPKMIAVTRLANEADALGFVSTGFEPYRYDTVFVPGETTLESVADALDIDPSRLRALNPHLIRGMTPPDEIYGVRIPVGLSADAVSGLAGSPLLKQADD
jgi:membrane-bound lytic murein transglycosylase D